MIPRSLKIWFIIHFIADYLIALPLMLFPVFTMGLFGFEHTDPVTARLTAAALLGIGGISLFARNASPETYRHLLLLKLLWSSAAAAGLIISYLQSAQTAALYFALIFLFFFGVWLYYYLKLKKP